MDIGKIIKAAQNGWKSGGIQWREEFIEKGVDPDLFLKLPGAHQLLSQYVTLPPQSKVAFLNTIYRRYPFLRN